jgi:MFS family permease
VNTLYLQEARNLSALHAGLYLLPMAAMTGICAPLSGRIVGSHGPRPSLIIAGVGMTVSGVLFAVFDAETHTPLLFVGYVLFGFGFGWVNAPITNTAVSGMPRSQAGVAAAVASTSRQIGSTLGVAVLGAVLAGGVAASSGAGGASAAYARAFSDAARPGWWILTACGLAVLVLGVATSGDWARRSATRAAARFEHDAPPVPVPAGSGTSHVA